MTPDTHQLKQIDPAQDIPDALVHEPAARDLLANLIQPFPLEPARARPDCSTTRDAAAGASGHSRRRVGSHSNSLHLTPWTATARVATPAEQTRWGQGLP